MTTQTIVKLVLSIFFSLGPMITIRDIGKPREPIKSGTAILSLIFVFIIIFCMWKFL